MDHKQLRAFLTIAETANMTRAAEALNLVQPAVSRQLRMLEDDVGVRLFHRERHGMALTDAGKVLLGYARRSMLELDRARAELSGSPTDVAGIVTVGLVPTTSDLLASPLVAAVTAHYPRIRLRVAMGYASTLQRWLESGEIDAAVMYGVEHEPLIESRPLLSEPFWVVGPASAGLQRRRPVPLASLAGKPMILQSGSIRMQLDRACAEAGIALDVSVETNAMSLQKSLVLGGHGLTLLPAISIVNELATSQLSGAPLRNPRIERTVLLALPASRAVARHVSHVVDLVVSCTKDAVRDGRWPDAKWLAD